MGPHYQMRGINPDGWEMGWGKFNLVLFISTNFLPFQSEKMSA